MIRNHVETSPKCFAIKCALESINGIAVVASQVFPQKLNNGSSSNKRSLFFLFRLALFKLSLLPPRSRFLLPNLTFSRFDSPLSRRCFLFLLLSFLFFLGFSSGAGTCSLLGWGWDCSSSLVRPCTPSSHM